METQQNRFSIRLKKSPSVFAGGWLAVFNLRAAGFHLDHLTEFQLRQC
jgi:hypothetical protein